MFRERESTVGGGSGGCEDCAEPDSRGVSRSLCFGFWQIIELGVPFTDPMADGATIQICNEVALAQGVGASPALETRE